MIVFMHVPKCAGTSFARSIIESLSIQSTLYGFDKTLFGAFSDLDSLSPVVRQNIHLSGLPRNEYEFIAGHFALSSTQDAFPSAKYITAIREPRIRLLSHFLYWRSQTDAQLADLGTWADIVRLARGSLMNFLCDSRVACQSDNILTRFLLMPHPAIPYDGFISEEYHSALAKEAFAAIKCFNFIDLIENPSFDINVERWVQRRFSLSRHNTTNIAKSLPICLSKELGRDCVNRLDALTAIDRCLYNAIARDKGVFDEREIDASFQEYVSSQSLLWA